MNCWEHSCNQERQGPWPHEVYLHGIYPHGVYNVVKDDKQQKDHPQKTVLYKDDFSERWKMMKETNRVRWLSGAWAVLWVRWHRKGSLQKCHFNWGVARRDAMSSAKAWDRSWEGIGQSLRACREEHLKSERTEDLHLYCTSNGETFKGLNHLTDTHNFFHSLFGLLWAKWKRKGLAKEQQEEIKWSLMVEINEKERGEFRN